MINIKKDQKQFIDDHGEKSYPNECCGIIFGTVDSNGVKEIKELLPVNNTREDKEQYHRFEISAEDLFNAEKTAEEKKLSVLGFYHSHPDHPAKPSEYDRQHAFLFYSYIIVSVNKGKAGDFTSWLLNDSSEFDEENINFI